VGELEIATYSDPILLTDQTLACAVPRRVAEEWPETGAPLHVAEDAIALLNANISMANEIRVCWRVIAAY